MRARALLGLMVLMLAAACGDDGGVFDGSSTPGSVTSEATTTVTTSTVATTTTAATTTSAATTTAAAVPELQVTGVPSQTSLETPPLVVNLNTPVLSGLPDEARQAAINQRAASELDARQNQFIVDATGAFDPANPGMGNFTLDIGFEVTALRGDLLSLRFTGSEYYQGAAHPGAVIFTMNFDLRTGFLVDLPDVLLANGTTALAALVEQHLIGDVYSGDDAALHSWIAAITPDMLGHWVASGSGIEVTFGQYDVGPGVMGTPTVIVPYAELAGVVDPGGLAGPAGS